MDMGVALLQRVRIPFPKCRLILGGLRRICTVFVQAYHTWPDVGSIPTRARIGPDAPLFGVYDDLFASTATTPLPSPLCTSMSQKKVSYFYDGMYTPYTLQPDLR